MWLWTCRWLVHQINSLYEVLKLEQNFRKNKVVTGKTPFFVISPSRTPHSICLNIGFADWAVFYGNVAFSILVLSSKKRSSNFLKKVFVFEKIGFKVKVLSMFKISSDSHIKTCWSLKRRAILKIPSTVF